MPSGLPPVACPGHPVRHQLAAGSVLYRMHSATFGPAEFNPTIANHPLKGGRFDSNDGRYAYLYAGDSWHVAIAETLVRDLPPGPSPPRIIQFSRVKERKLSEVRLERSLELVNLFGAHLGHVGQDPWLTKCGAAEYSLTREWANAIRRWVPTAHGFVWRSFRDEDRYAYVLFGDRVPAGALTGTVKMDADSGAGLLLVRAVLQQHNVTL
jgi:hypothetical protein